ncbi:hydrogenase expression/formation protein HypE [Photobacterium damselae]|uniref:hydrogenase expression/formation protein HypE n=1 Tax=Photobacterium damselae TaxID=38293 RepID=UPI001EFD9090|nr:hydrogenase expression/formation protein HypE [Photobacterium damselae]MCG9780648.1 hydrogenase expression/formation protein HypE [Photobacterium damselae]
MIKNEFIVLDHGTGAKLSQRLVELITETLDDVHIGKMEDAAVLKINSDRIAITTDSFVVTPLFFNNGDIGKISVCGTVNDLAVMGATPKYITLSLILEVGLPIVDLLKIVSSIRDCAREANVKIVAGDTKVVNRGEVDKIFINTTGVGVFKRESLKMSNVVAGDKFILTGSLGNHSVHLLSMREGLGFESIVESDCAPLNGVIDKLLDSKFSDSIRSIRDVTRGGFAEIMHEYAQALNLNMKFSESDLPIQTETAMAAEMLGLEPIHLANEGCLCIFVDGKKASEITEFLREFYYTKDSVVVGIVTNESGGDVLITKKDGTKQKLEQLEGAELPRLC